MKKFKYLLFTLLILIPQFVFAEDIYDVVLFWGQSNMVGRSGKNSSERKYDARVTELGISGFSSVSGVKMSIVKNYTTMNHVDVSIEKGTVYEYRLSSNELVEINSNTKTLGEDLYPVVSDNEIYFSTIKNNNKSLESSAGTNMIPQFGYTYYKLTGHKVIAVFCAQSALEIASFLPQDMVAEYGGKEGLYLYEAIEQSYKGAVKYLYDHDMKIGNKFYVSMQGEADVKYADKYYLENNTLEYEVYYDKFLLLHKRLRKDLGLEFGVIAETSHTLGSAKSYGVEVIHFEQENLAIRNDDIIIGSSFAYKNFIPSSKYYKGKQPYSELYLQYRNITSVVGENESNMIHYNSAALSQIGDDCATQAASYANKEKAMQNVPDSDDKIFLEIAKSNIGNWKFDLIIGVSFILLALGIHLYQRQKRY